MEYDIKKLINQLDKKFYRNKKVFGEYIDYIRFPKYKALLKDTKINFEYPLTALVGVNGTNKTSVLQALYGCPGSQSVGNYWFSTEVDQIDDKTGNRNSPHCFIYSYYHKGADKNVEVLKTRVRRRGNPDYWEPSRPIIRYKMDTIRPQELEESKNKSKTRWDTINKNTVFCDFKEYVSAFDMFFYNYEFNAGKKIKTRQDFIRSKSKHLMTVINEKKDSYPHHGIERIAGNTILSKDTVEKINEILGESYKNITIVKHKFYSLSNTIKPLKTIYIQKDNLDYSEAFAGSGESRVIILVNEILNAPPNSLIIIDEPEINLHPKALQNLQIFLLKEILIKSHQIIMTTHSHDLIDYLPNKAIKLFKKNGDTVSVEENVDYNDAFLVLGEKMNNDINIIVEDKLVEEIIKISINNFNVKSMKEKIEVNKMAGGVQHIIQQHIYSSAMKEEKNMFYILDGDINNILNGKLENYSRWIINNKINPDSIPETENGELDKIIELLIGFKLKIGADSGKSKINQENMIKRKFLKYWKNHVYFLNNSTPEQEILKSLNKLDNIENAKEYYAEKAKNMLNKHPSSDEIVTIQLIDFNGIDEKTDFKKTINNILEDIWYNIKNEN